MSQKADLEELEEELKGSKRAKTFSPPRRENKPILKKRNTSLERLNSTLKAIRERSKGSRISQLSIS